MTESAASHENQIIQAALHKATARVFIGVNLFHVAALGVAAMLWPVVSHKRILLWLLLFVLAHLNLVWFQIRYNKVEGTKNLNLTQWRFRRNLALSLMGAAWGWVSIFLWPSYQPVYQLALPMTMLAASATMVISTPGFKIGYMIYTLLAFGPVIGRLIIEGTWPQYWVVFIGIIIVSGWFWLGNNLREWINRTIIVGIENRELADELKQKNSDLYDALGKIKTLSGMLPICANCKRIRDDKGYYQQIEHYITEHSDAEFTHGICPDCVKELYPHIKLTDR